MFLTATLDTAGWSMVRALVVALGLAPATLTAATVTVTTWPSPNPPSATLVAVTVWVLPPAVTRYSVIGRPLLAGTFHRTRMVPLVAASVVAVRPVTAA